ncbi:MAG: Tex-like protein [Massilibacillus sp.]|nr:Tex-like protein [Massilibacillus sp.]
MFFQTHSINEKVGDQMILEEITGFIAKELAIKPHQVKATIDLLDDGNTVPFISRYRKEATNELNEDHIRTIEERLQYLRNLVKRQEDILANIEEQGKMTPELKIAIERSTKLQELEDLYLPYKQKKRTRAQIAREKGLEPLAELILSQELTSGTPLNCAAEYINEEKEVPSAELALAGAMDIIAETVCEQATIRAFMRKQLWQYGELSTDLVAETEESKAFLMYKEHREPVNRMPSHRILAMNRGEKKDILKVKLETNHDTNIDLITRRIITKSSIFTECIAEAITDGYKRLLFPALDREIRSLLTENAEKQAIRVFGLNLKQLLLQQPLAGHTILGLDPGYRTGCKMAVISPTGAVLEHGVLYLTASDAQREQAGEKVLALIKKHNITLVSIGNGTASYETEEFTAKLIADNNLAVNYLITNEAGASVYSASKLAKDELPDYDVTIRGAVSIARRVQDPLAELVKIDPKSIGVGQYQHDVNQKELSGTLDNVVESAVNHVGVELNTASIELLKHVSGINATVAKNIVAYRDENGKFNNRKEILKVARLGQSAFTQCAGFLRIAGSKSPLDNTPVHPESYKIAENIVAELGFALTDLNDKDKVQELQAKFKTVDVEAVAKKLEAGVPTVRDIIDALAKPGRDPREDLPAPLTRKSIVKLTDLAVGTIVKGTVHNITDFGAFVDIGIKTAGLIHRSELSHKFFRHPLDVISVGDIIDVMIISIDADRNRIGLSLKQVEKIDK